MHAPTSSYIEVSGSTLPVITDHVVQGYRRHTNYSPLTRSYHMDGGYAVDRTSDEPRNSHLHRPADVKIHSDVASPSGRTGPNASFHHEDTFRQPHPTSSSTLPRPVLPLSNQVHPQHVYQQFQNTRSHIPPAANGFERQEYVSKRNETHINYSNERLHPTGRHFPIDNRYQHLEPDTGSHRNDYGTSRSELRRQSQNEQQVQFWHDKHPSEDHIHSQHQQQLPQGSTSNTSLRWFQTQNSLMNNQDPAAPVFRQESRHNTPALRSPSGQYSRNPEPDCSIVGYKPKESISLHAQPTHTHGPVTDGFRTPATIHPAKQLYSDAACLQERTMHIDDQEMNDYARRSDYQMQERALGSREHQRPRKESSPWNGAVNSGTENQSKGSHTPSSKCSLVNLMCQDDIPQNSRQIGARYNDPLSRTNGRSRATHIDGYGLTSTSTERGRLPEAMVEVICIDETDPKIERPGGAVSPTRSRNLQPPVHTRLDSSNSCFTASGSGVSTRRPEDNAIVESQFYEEKRDGCFDQLQLDTNVPLKLLVPPDPVIDFAQMDLASLKLYQQRFGIPAPLRRCHTARSVPHADLAKLVARHFKKNDSWPWISRPLRSVLDIHSSRKSLDSISNPQLLASRKRPGNDSSMNNELDEGEMKIEQDRVRDSFIHAIRNQRDARAFSHTGYRNAGSLGEERELPLGISEATDSDETSDDMDIDIENDSDAGTTFKERYFSTLRTTSTIVPNPKKKQKADSKSKDEAKSSKRKNGNGNSSGRKKSSQSTASENSQLHSLPTSLSNPLPAPPTAAILRRQSSKKRNSKGKGKPSIQPSNNTKVHGSNITSLGISTTETSNSISTTPTNPSSTGRFQSTLTTGGNVNQLGSKLVETSAHNRNGINSANSAYGGGKTCSSTTVPSQFSTPVIAPLPQNPTQIPKQLPWSAADVTPNGDANVGSDKGDEEAPGSAPARVIYVGGVGNGIVPGRGSKEWGMS